MKLSILPIFLILLAGCSKTDDGKEPTLAD